MTEQADQIRSSRRHFAAPGGSHDRIVRFLASALPAAIGALLAVMILAPLSPRGEISFLLDRNKVAMLQDRLRVVSAMYRGEDDRGRNFSVTAGNAVQHTARESVVEMKDVTARVMLNDGPAILTTDAGDYDFGKQVIGVPGAVNFQSADGYRMVTQGANIDLNTRRMVSNGRVEGRIPAGTFSADSIIADLEQRTVTLDGHARLRMEPGKLQMPGKQR
ncbi:LPS export ABC transporter periplasmic protein LptC [Novosphingobium cyanobacteriorum]|uniref:LPS export ABC transporter periplasmic protein LptC n=1 Tax=Novosphingobium cyanobacteriorum TaxID=3024215 RepID=A0ABT6CGS0_9SPHN|nr:LPS export ABC transporter periplasmic protein LptC [Novosphingobium cyanobacteriorum]MDF8333129.1 LPS export ABC transporter periplasmic protein LptC [Novosphingobium cyanobacteriorum]